MVVVPVPGAVEVAALGDAEPRGVLALLLPLQQEHAPLLREPLLALHAVHNLDPEISACNQGAGETPRLQYGVPGFLWADKISSALCNPVEGEAG